MIISIDTGNKNTKTDHDLCTTAIEESDFKPPFAEEWISYEGKFYAPGGKRIPYTREKVNDSRFTYLILLTIGREIKRQNIKNDHIIEVELLLGLPPAHFAGQKDHLKEYYQGKMFQFAYKNMDVRIHIKNVEVYIQGHAAIYTNPKLLTENKNILVNDMGGFTDDYLYIRKGKVTKFGTMELGIIPFYNQVIDNFISMYDLHLEEDDIDDLILTGDIEGCISDNVKKEMLSYIQSSAKRYLKQIFSSLNEDGIDFKMITTVFIGGGSIIFKKYIEEMKEEGFFGNVIFIDDIYANAKGYRVLYNEYRRRKNR